MKRFLLIGLDGGELSLLTPWMDAGHLPHLAALRQQGTCQALASTRPPVTFPAWTTCVTGVNPGRHGIFDFTETCPGDYAIRFINQTHRRTPALWNILACQAPTRLSPSTGSWSRDLIPPCAPAWTVPSSIRWRAIPR